MATQRTATEDEYRAAAQQARTEGYRIGTHQAMERMRAIINEQGLLCHSQVDDKDPQDRGMAYLVVTR